ncbi:hypothetical protein V2J09_018028 [Rumex salicifolius]
MLTLSRMKHLIFSPALSLLSPSTFPKLSPFPLSSFPISPAFSSSSSLCINPNYMCPQRSLSLPKPYLSRRFCATRADASEYTSSTSSCGEIHVIMGPMFAGKTTTLLYRIQSEQRNGRNVAVIKSIKDTRYGLSSIVTHDGHKYPCLPLADLSSFRAQFGSRAYDELDVIGIDEAQFFGDLYEFCRKAADHDGKIVIVAGLDGDYLRKKFGSVLDIIPLADTVTKLTAQCELCGKRANFTLRKNEERQTELIGGAEVYMPVCRQHYVSGQVVIEATRMVLHDKVQCS